MTINGQEITAKEFAYDGCHKIYLLNTKEDKEEFEGYGGYEFHPINLIQTAWDNSCPLKFISNANFINDPVEQGQKAIFA